MSGSRIRGAFFMRRTDNENERDRSKRAPSEQTYSIYLRGVLLLIVVGMAAYVVVRYVSVFGNVLVVLLGFGAVVIVHEFGHFLVAKLSDIKVEAFSIFMPPTLVGVRRTAEGFRIRVLPQFFPKRSAGGEQDEESLLSFTVGRAGKAGETEYRLGLIPLGGFVKMLGQDDAGPSKSTDDPRSYANKPVGTRMAVIAAGVTFNALSAIVAFMVVFLVGIRLLPPIVGGVVPGSPAERAGLRGGDEVIEIAGKSKTLDFSNIMVAAALSGKGEHVELKVKRDGEVLSFSVLPEQLEGSGVAMRLFGIIPPKTLRVAQVSDPNVLLEQAGLMPGDRIVAVNDKPVQAYWDMAEIIENTTASSVALTAKRKDSLRQTQRIKLDWRVSTAGRVESEADLCHVCSMVPRLRVKGVEAPPVSLKRRVLEKVGLRRPSAHESPLKVGDIIVAVGEVENPSYKELEDMAGKYEGRPLDVKVLRIGADGSERLVTVVTEPRRPPGEDRARIGIGVVLDADHPVVAKTIPVKGFEQLRSVPRGAVIKAVNGVAVSSFYDVAGLIKSAEGGPVSLEYVAEGVSGEVVLPADAGRFVDVRAGFAVPIPFEDLKRLYKAAGPVEAIAIGYRKTVMFIAQTYITLKRLLSGLVSPKSLMGPLGILAVSYTVVTHQPWTNYVYLLALISACIAVINLLPLPPFDGGHIVLLVVEKIRGSALSERTQGAIAYAGVVLVIALFVYLTFNDLLNIFIR